MTAAESSGSAAHDSAAAARHAPPDPSVLAHAGSTIASSDIAAGTAVAVESNYADGSVRSQTVETRAGGLRDVGLLTPGQGMPGA